MSSYQIELAIEPWILAVVTAMGWNGTDVTFQEFTSKERSVQAMEELSEALNEAGGGHKWTIRCFPK